jgi:hypothetical protein
MLFGIVRAKIGMIPLYTILTRLLVVAFYLALPAWPARSPCRTFELVDQDCGVVGWDERCIASREKGSQLTVTHFAMRVNYPIRLVRGEILNWSLVTVAHSGAGACGTDTETLKR